MASQRSLILFTLTCFTCLLTDAYHVKVRRDADITDEEEKEEENELDAAKAAEESKNEESVDESKDEPEPLEEENEEIPTEDVPSKDDEPTGEDDNQEDGDEGKVVSENDQQDIEKGEPEDDDAENDEKGFEIPSPADEETPGTSISDEDIPFNGGFFFDSPFFSFEQVKQYFKNLERAMENIFQQTMSRMGFAKDGTRNTTDQVIEVNGQKYNVHTNVIKGGDEHNAVSIEAISVLPVDKKRKRRTLW